MNEENALETTSKKENFKKKFNQFLNYISKTTSGMAIGMFATLIIGVIIDQIGSLTSFDFLIGVAKVLKGLMGVGIGVGVAMSQKKYSPLAIISFGVSGALATMVISLSDGALVLPYINGLTSNNNPLMPYLVVLIAMFFYDLIFKKQTPVDLIIVPLFIAAISALFAFLLSFPLTGFVVTLGNFIQWATTMQPLLMGSVIATVMGMILTAPISSVAIAVAINLGGIAGGAAAVGCSVQMVGFMIMSIRDNNAGKVISVGIGTSMLQFQNIIKKPIIWLPTIITSALLGPLSTMVFQLQTSKEGAGMGTCALIGPLTTILEMQDNLLMAILGVLLLMIIGPALIVFLIDLLFRKLNWIKKGDLAI